MTPQIRDFRGKRVHMIGIGGSSMSGLARMLRARGVEVTGSDNYDSYLLKGLRSEGVPVTLGHRAENVHGADLAVFSAAIAPDNPERAEARRLGIPEMERSTLLGQLMAGSPVSFAVSGTHGKTTTTAMLSQILIEGGLDPSVHLGGSFDLIGGGTRTGGGDFFVAEACEYHGSFLEMRPTAAIILNIQEDHLDYYRDIDHITEAFCRFAQCVAPDGLLIGNAADPRVREVLRASGRRYELCGFTPGCDWYAHDLEEAADGTASFAVSLRGSPYCRVRLHVPGDFNRLNALTALAASHEAGVPAEAAAEALGRFCGVHRRLELTSTTDGVRVYHDYGHNPVEMRGALSVMKRQPHGTLWAVMQPHTYSRVKTLFRDFIDCCRDADEILITDICAAREKDPGDINSGMLVDAIRKTGQSVHLTPGFDDAERYLRSHWRPGDLVLTMGCGNINELNDQIARHGDSRP